MIPSPLYALYRLRAFVTRPLVRRAVGRWPQHHGISIIPPEQTLEPAAATRLVETVAYLAEADPRRFRQVQRQVRFLRPGPATLQPAVRVAPELGLCFINEALVLRDSRDALAARLYGAAVQMRLTRLGFFDAAPYAVRAMACATRHALAAAEALPFAAEFAESRREYLAILAAASPSCRDAE